MNNPAPKEYTAQEIAAKTRRDFLALGFAGVASVVGWRWISTRPAVNAVAGPLRSVLEANEAITKAVLFDHKHLAPQFDKSRIQEIRSNGEYGLDEELDAAAWRLQVRPFGASAARTLTLADVQSLPKVEQTIEFKCIEGWSTVSNWGGARLSDFIARFAPGSERAGYVGMETPDGAYFVGLDRESALHPQTLLAYERNGQPLEEEHGAPLRLVIPVKYGVKNIKRIGMIAFSDEKPRDFWAQEGYDYYAAL